MNQYEPYWADVTFCPPLTEEILVFSKPPVRNFLIVTFTFSWGMWGVALLCPGSYLDLPGLPFFLLGSFGPMIGAAVMRRWRPARPEAGPAVRGSLRCTVSPLVLAVCLGAAGSVISSLATWTTGSAGISLHAGRAGVYAYLGSPLLFFVATLVMGPLSEEPGWRGYLQPHLREHMSPLRMSLAFGPLWALWHLPLFFIDGTYQNSLGVLSTGGLTFLISTTALTVAVAFAYEQLGGLPAAICVHFMSNLLPVVLGLASSAALAWDAVGKILLALVLLRSWHRIRQRQPMTAVAGAAAH
ncbi:type II CAAX prenyl endopeptidase Rce1 family protein [Streptomyces sp. NPDC048192]|uniref:CPBP family glutamic-type intramembrane protease n=1 Tax=Streptomyces sp. NPDC048192 TaxID=3365510 RepID=UPI00372305B7